MADPGELPAQLGGNRRLNARDLQRLYANPNSGGYLLVCIPVLFLSLLKALIGALLAAFATGAVAMALSLRSLPANVSRAASTAWRTRYLGLISRALTLLVVLPLATLAWPLAHLVMGMAQGASEAGRFLFNRTSDSLQPAGQHGFMFVESPWAAGVSMAMAELRCLVARFSRLNERDLPAWLDKHVPASPLSPAPSLPQSSVSSADKGALAKPAPVARDAEVPAPAPAAPPAQATELSVEERVARGFVAGLVGVLGGAVGAFGMLVLGACHTGKVSVYTWRQLSRWASWGPQAFAEASATSTLQQQAGGNTTGQQQHPQQQQQQCGPVGANVVAGSNGASSLMGKLASAATLPHKTSAYASTFTDRPSRLSLACSSSESLGLASIHEGDEQAGNDAMPPDAPLPQRSSHSNSSDSANSAHEGEGAATHCTAVLATPEVPAVAEAPQVNTTTTATSTAPAPEQLSTHTGAPKTQALQPAADTAAPQGAPNCSARGQQGQEEGCRCGGLSCLRWVAVLPLFPLVPLLVLGFFLLTSLTWLLGGCMLSVSGAFRASTWGDVFTGGLEPVVDALESLHLSVVQTCAKARTHSSGSPAGSTVQGRCGVQAQARASKRCMTHQQQAAAGGTAAPSPAVPMPTLPEPAHHLAINISPPEPCTSGAPAPQPPAAQQQQEGPTGQRDARNSAEVVLSVGAGLPSAVAPSC